jgi:hypothetical protein
MRARSLPAWLFAIAALGCAGKEFQGDGGTSGSATGSSGGVGGAAGSAGTPNGGTGGAAAGGGGSAGMPSCTCAPTEYCRNGECLPCAELSTLDFAEPELLLDDPELSLRFPRDGGPLGSLFYRAGNDGSGHIHYTPNATTLGPLVGSPDVNQQSGALFVRELDRTFNLIFDETNQGTRTARAGAWNGTTLSSQMEMPPPLSPGGFEDYSVAAAGPTGRLFWMSTRDGVARLRTGMIETGNGDIVNIDVPKRTGSGTCVRDGADATPWVTPDSRRLFFRAFPLDDACQPLDAATTDLYVVPLEPTTGMAVQPALALASLNEVGTTDTDPSLSPDFCTLYFASDRGSTGNSDFKLYRAARR